VPSAVGMAVCHHPPSCSPSPLRRIFSVDSAPALRCERAVAVYTVLVPQVGDRDSSPMPGEPVCAAMHWAVAEGAARRGLALVEDPFLYEPHLPVTP